MSRLWSSGAEENSTTIEGQLATGSVSIDAVTFRSGAYSYKTAAAGSAAYYTYQYQTSNDNNRYWVRAYIYISSLPSAEDKVLWIDETQTDGVISLRLETSGALRLYNEAPITPAQIGLDSQTLSTNTWYRLELAFDNTTASSSVVTAYINGLSFASGTVDTSRHGGQAIVGWGSRNNVAATYYFDDLGVNDSTGSFQNGLLGDGQIVHLRPNAAGDNNAFSVQVGGTAGSANNYTRVNENPPDDSTSYNGDALSSDTDDFNIDNTPSSIGSNDTVNVTQVGVRFRAVIAAAEASFKVRIKKTASGTVSSSAAITPNSTSWLTNQVTVPTNNYPLTLYQNPDSTNWTKATLDTAQIGYTISTTNTNAADITAVWLLVDSTPNLPVSVADSTTAAESIAYYSDLVNVMESVNLLVTNIVKPSDSTTVSETLTLLVSSNRSVSDSVTVSEALTLNDVEVPSLTDSATTSESVTLLAQNFINVSDSTTLSETVQLLVTNFVNTNDSTTVSETLQLVSMSFVSANEVGSLSEAASLQIPTITSISDSSTVADSLSRYSDTVDAVESVNIALVDNSNIADSVSTNEVIALSLQSFVNTSDTTSPLVALIQSGTFASGVTASSYSFSFTSNVTVGSLLVLGYASGAGGAVVSDNLNGTWLTAENQGSGSYGIAYIQNSLAGTITITITQSSAFPLAANFYEFGGIDWFSALDQVNYQQTAPASSSVSISTLGPTAGRTELVFGLEVSFSSNGISNSSSYSNFLSQTSPYTIATGTFIGTPGIQTLNWTKTGSAYTSNDFIATFTVRTPNDVPTLRPLSFTSVTDSVATAENLSVIIFGTPIPSDSVTLTESISLSVTGSQTVSDVASLSETVTMFVPSSSSVADSVASSETLGLIDIAFTSIAETITIAESRALTLVCLVNVNDSSTVAETFQASESITISLPDNISAIDQVILPGNPSLQDNISVIDSLSYYSDLVLCGELVTVKIAQPSGSFSESVTTSETMTVVVVSLVSTSDASLATEALSASINYPVTPVESVAVSETRGIVIALTVAILDNRITDESGNFILDESGNFITDEHPADLSTLSETTNIARVDTAHAIDASTISESVTVQPPIESAAIGDSIAVGEIVNIAQVDTLAVSDSSTSSDTVAIAEADQVSSSDSTVLFETFSLRLDESLSVADSASLSEVLRFSGDSFSPVSDSGSAAEVITLVITDLYLAVSDSVAISDTANVSGAGPLFVSDSSQVSELAQLLLPILYGSVAESSAVIDTPLLALENNSLFTDTSALSETVTLESDSLISLSDSSVTFETYALQITTTIIVNESANPRDDGFSVLTLSFLSFLESVSASELSRVDVPASISQSEDSSLADSSAVYFNVTISLTESIILSEALGLDTPVIVQGAEVSVLTEQAQLLIPLLFTQTVDSLNLDEQTTVSRDLTISTLERSSLSEAVNTHISAVPIAVTVFFRSSAYTVTFQNSGQFVLFPNNKRTIVIPK